MVVEGFGGGVFMVGSSWAIFCGVLVVVEEPGSCKNKDLLAGVGMAWH